MRIAEFYPRTIEILLTDEMVQNYTEVSQDWNPIHCSKDAAKQAGYTEKIVQGMLTMAISTRLVSPLLGERDIIQSFNMKFSSVLYVNERLTITAAFLSDNAEKATIQISGKNKHGQVIIKGKLIISKKGFS